MCVPSVKSYWLNRQRWKLFKRSSKCIIWQTENASRDSNSISIGLTLVIRRTERMDRTRSSAEYSTQLFDLPPAAIIEISESLLKLVWSSLIGWAGSIFHNLSHCSPPTSLFSYTLKLKWAMVVTEMKSKSNLPIFSHLRVKRAKTWSQTGFNPPTCSHSFHNISGVSMGNISGVVDIINCSVSLKQKVKPFPQYWRK